MIVIDLVDSESDAVNAIIILSIFQQIEKQSN